MRTLAIAAAFALLGTGAVAQSTMSDSRSMERTTTTTRSHSDGMHDRADERTTTRHTTAGSSHHRMAARSTRHCKTWWKHGRKMRTCKTMRRHHR